MKKLVIIIASCLSINAFSQNLSGSYLGIWSTDSHLGQFGFVDAGQTRPRVDIWGSPNKINFRTTYNTGGAALSFGTNAVNDALLINEDGNVGIGTIAPSQKLTVEGIGYGTLVKIKNLTPAAYTEQTFYNDNNNILTLGTIGSSYSSSEWAGSSYMYSDRKLYIKSTDKIDFFSGGYSLNNIRMTINSNGNVGIGTTAPFFKTQIVNSILDNSAFNTLLSIDGNVNTESANNNFDISKPSIGLVFRRDWNNMGTPKALAGIYAWGSYNWGGGLAFTTTPAYSNGVQSTRMVVTDNGNVGIGTTNPGNYKLAVEGTIGAREVKVTTAAWADFVFHPSYKLRTLGEVEQFIKTNNHLPEIPTEAEVKENGVGLGEMNARLLQKIEELTLYMIEQQKQINELKEQNLKFSKDLETIKK